MKVLLRAATFFFLPLLLLLPDLVAAQLLRNERKHANEPVKPPMEFDCGMRQLAVDFAFHLQPFRSKDTFQKIVDGLTMKGGAPGGETLCFNATVPEKAPDSFRPKFDLPKNGAHYFVDAQAGNDNPRKQDSGGSIESPFRTVQRALQEVRDNKRKRKHHANGIDYAIVFREGVHYINETIDLMPEDSRISFQNYKDEIVWLSGAVQLLNDDNNNNNSTADGWTKYDNPHNRSIWALDLSNRTDIDAITGLRINRTRAVRARYPNGCTSEQPLPSGYNCMGYAHDNKVVSPEDGFGSNLLTQWVPVPPVTMHQDNWTQYEPDDAPQRQSGKWFNRYQIGIGGTCQGQFTPPAGYWCGSSCAGGAPKPPGCIISFAKGILVDKDQDVLPNYPYQNPGRAVVQAWRPGHWASWMFQVDGEKSNDTHIMFGKGGFQGARAVTAGEAFFIENAEEELDMDNEFYYKPEEKLLLYYQASEDPPQGTVEVPMVKTLFRIQGNQSHPVEGIRFLGLGVRDTRLTYLDEHTMAAGGDWGLNIRGAIEARGVNKLKLDSCTFEELDGNAVFVKGYARDLVIQNNDFHLTGGNMVALLGETEAPGLPAEWGFGWNGTAGNQPRGSLVRNNIAYRPGLFAKQSSFFFQSKSMQTTLQNNIFFHGPRAGINFNDGFGGGNIFENNLLFASVMETGDHGPFNSWDRQPFAHSLKEDGSFDMDKIANDTVRHNFIIGNYYGQETVDNDDGSGFFDTHHNFLVYGQHGQKADFGGHSNYHHENLYAFLNGQAVMPDAGSETKLGEELQFYNNTVIATTTVHYILARCWGRIQTVLRNNRIYTPDGTMDKVCDMTLEERISQGLDNGTIVSAWPPTSDILAIARELLLIDKKHTIATDNTPLLVAPNRVETDGEAKSNPMIDMSSRGDYRQEIRQESKLKALFLACFCLLFVSADYFKTHRRWTSRNREGESSHHSHPH